jgi:hypothetical protein
VKYLTPAGNLAVSQHSWPLSCYRCRTFVTSSKR